METKYVRVPFEVELAKNITDKSVEGRIVTRNGRNARIICWDAKCEGNIVALVEDKAGAEYLKSYASDGLIFLKGVSDGDLMLEIPEYMTFKEGDVIAFGNNEDKLIIGIFQKDTGEYSHKCYVNLNCYGFLVYDAQPLTYDNSRFATEEEKQKLIEALKASEEPKAKEYLKRFFGIEQKQEYEFKPFDKVLVRDDEEDDWKLAEYSHKTESNQYYVVGGLYWLRCIPYNEKTAHLLGKTEDYKEE